MNRHDRRKIGLHAIDPDLHDVCAGYTVLPMNMYCSVARPLLNVEFSEVMGCQGASTRSLISTLESSGALICFRLSDPIWSSNAHFTVWPTTASMQTCMRWH
eukprot:CAMPEP_0177170604 /NCGR_PEP_ID=MMETSP0367-20130122/10186_1 /TAXON_ID=447022 ORGANISM="Scrippsiella hangoei-like, Strain SHHI-4" /NCGR_SAMPLE_ID=MMETSP0367 /ASSEMBLY_ACC=CAM_ASM_000362 /LENGTH=101 /DNA_ID=CAMNT_0018616811 /DNA_START=461 /DNA_END=767 /DNA_ORIENTATION=-